MLTHAIRALAVAVFWSGLVWYALNWSEIQTAMDMVRGL